MYKLRKHILLVVLLCAVISLILPMEALANSARPPSLIIIVKNPPKDISIVLVNDKEPNQVKFNRGAWEGHYAFYSINLEATNQYTFKVTANGENFECKLNTPLQHYTNIFNLDISKRELTAGTYPFRGILIILFQLLLTLLFEGIIFWIFGYRQKRSWIIFICVNLVTQGILNIILGSEGWISSYYLGFLLILGELLVFILEMIAFPVLVKEHGKIRSITYAIISNFISLFIGGYIISALSLF